MMAEWKVYEFDTPQCTSCGMWMPFARYRKCNGINGREITNFCPHCGQKMTAIPICKQCSYAKEGNWKDDGICFACRERVWVPNRAHRSVVDER